MQTIRRKGRRERSEKFLFLRFFIRDFLGVLKEGIRKAN